MLHGLHLEKRLVDVFAITHRAVVAHHDGVVLGNIGQHGLGERGGAGQAVLGQRHAAQSDDHFRKQRQVKGLAGGGEAGRHRRVRVYNRADIRPQAVNRGVHGDLRSALFAPFNLLALHVDDNQVVDVQHALAHAGRGGQNAVLIQPNRDIAVVGGDPTFLIHQAADLDDVLPILFLRFHHAEFPIVPNPHEIELGSLCVSAPLR